VPRHAGYFCVSDKLDRIGAARVLRNAGVAKLDVPVGLVEHHVLEHRAETQGLENVGLGLIGQVDGLGVAAPFDVEDAGVAPTMLVVADEQPLGIGRERGFAGARQTEQQRGAARVAVGRGRAMHRQDAPLGHNVVHDREHALLHLAGVLGPQNHQLTVLEADVDAGLGGHAGCQPIGGKFAGVVDHVVRLAKIGQLLPRRANEHGVHEQRVIRPRANHADLDAKAGVPAGEAVYAVQPRARVEPILGPLAIDLEAMVLQGQVDRPPPDVRLGLRTADHALVFGRAPCLGPAVDHQSPAAGDAGIDVLPHGALIEIGRRRIAPHFLDVQVVVSQAEARHRL